MLFPLKKRILFAIFVAGNLTFSIIMKKILRYLLGCFLVSIASTAQAQECDISNQATITRIGPGAFPYTSPTSGIAVSARLVGISSIANTTYSCGGNSYACSSPAWWIGSSSSTDSIILTFSAPVNNFSVVVNGFNSGEMFTFNSLGGGTVSLGNHCTASVSVSGNQASTAAASAIGTLISVFNTVKATQYVITHNGATSGARITLLDCFGATKVGPAGVNSGIQLWLDGSDVTNSTSTNPGDGTKVAVWKDISGNGNDATVLSGQDTAKMHTAQINGKDVMQFTRVSGSSGSVYEVAGVDLRATTMPQSTIFTVYRQGAHAGEWQGIWGDDDGGWDRFFMPTFGNDNGIVSVGPPTNNVAVTNSGVTGETKLLTAVYHSGVTDSSIIYFNAVPVTRVTDNTHATNAKTTLRIGWDGDDNPYHGDIAEMVVYNRKLTECEIKAVNRYFGYKYNVTFTSATITPSGNQYYCTGSSKLLTASTGTAYQWLKDGAIIPSATSATYSATSSGSYKVIVTESGCSDTSAATIVKEVPNRIYVDSSVATTGTGASWASPVKTVQEALEMANNVTCAVEIWVKKGTYYPMVGTAKATSRDSSLRIYRNNIKLYGGFSGTETLLSARSVSGNPTILSGDIGTSGDSTDNAFHTLTIVGNTSNLIDTNTVIDGFTITKGNADGSGMFTGNTVAFYRADGGGICIVGMGTGNKCSPLIENCTITRNNATWGAGFLNAAHNGGYSFPVVRNCTLSYNRSYQQGGGFHSWGDGTNPVLTVNFSNCVFDNNASASHGAGGSIRMGGTGASSPHTFTNCTFTSNNATGMNGGGINYEGNNSTGPTFTNCTFTNNIANWGGAIALGTVTSSTISHCTFTGNTAPYVGGALAISNANINIDHSTLQNNGGSSFGSAIVHTFGTARSMTITASTISGHKGGSNGTIYLQNDVALTMDSITATTNNANVGGFLYINTANTALTLSNSVFTQDTANYGSVIRTNSTQPSTISNCRFLNNYAGVQGTLENVNGGTLTVTRSVFHNNKAGTNGAALLSYNTASVTNLNDCILSNNSSTGTGGGGGAIDIQQGTVNLNNTTLSNNTTASTSQPNTNSVWMESGTTLNVNNSIIWGGAAQHVSGAGTGNYNYALVKGLGLTTPSLSSDPQFVNAADPDGADNSWGTSDDGLYLTPCSPCLNTGSNALIPGGLTTDFASATRIQNTTVDMGAYEHGFAAQGIPDVTISASQNPVCTGTNVTFSYIATWPGSSTSFAWYKNSTLVSSTSSYSSSSLAYNDTVWLVMTNNDCALRDTSNRIIMKVNMGRIYVDSAIAASGTGMSWSSPYKTLGEALTLANSTPATCATEIWVKKGTYYPGTHRDSSFRIARNNIKVYGGFAGTETLLSARSASTNLTTLSGDIGTAGDSTDNTYHVVTVLASSSNQIDTNTIIDGFTISGANGVLAAGGFSYGGFASFNRQDGGGILLHGVGSGNKCSPLINNCIVSRNGANFGGGVYAAGFSGGNSSPVIRNCTFVSNRANNNGGGAFISGQTSGTTTALVDSCVFSSNTAANGAGIFYQGSSGTVNTLLRNTTVQNNTASAAGGGIFTNGNCTITGTNLLVLSNTAANGGGLYNPSSATVTWNNCRFSSNTATATGGGILSNAGTLNCTQCIINNNTASNTTSGTGGGLQHDGGTGTYTNSLFVANTAAGTSGNGGGAICQNGSGSVVNLRSSTLSGNSTSSTSKPDANTVFTAASTTMNVLNTIIWGSATTHVSASGTINYTNALVRGASLSAPSLSADPRFVNESSPAGADGIWLTSDDGLDLLPCSPAVNVATAAAPATDIRNRSRVGLPDMGAYEEQGLPTPGSPAVMSPVTYCQTAIASPLTAAKSGVSDTLRWYDATPTLLPGAPTPSTATAGTTTYYVSQVDVRGCEGPKATITVVVNPRPAAPTVSTPVNYCVGATATALTATKSSATDTLKWYNSSLTLLPGAPTPSTATAGTFTWYVSQKTSLGCEGNKATITVNVNDLAPAPTVTSPVTYCQGATAGVLTATAASASDTLKWYNSSMTLLPGAPTPSTATVGTTPYYVSQKNIAGCEGAKATINVVVNATPAAPAATTSVTYCQNASSVPLTATLSAGSDTLKWYNSSLAPLSGAPTPSTLVPGTYTWYVSQKTSLGCEGPKTTITVTVNPTPAAPAAPSPVTYCQGATAVPLTATLASATDTLKWYNSSMTLLSGAPTPSTATVGTFTWYVSDKTALGCEGPKKTINVVINPTPLAPAATTPVVYCQGVTAIPLSATLAAGSDTLKWYNSSMTSLAGAPTPSTATVGTFTWYVSQKTSLGCEGPKTTITVTINPTPALPTAATPITYCQGATATALTATAATASDTLKWYDATPTLLSGAPTPSTTTPGTFTWSVSQKNNYGCEGAKRTITVQVNPTPTAPPAVTPVTYCQDDVAVPLSATKASASDTLKWYNASLVLIGSTAPTPSTTTAGTYTWYVSGKTALGCEGPKTTINVTVNPKPAAPVVSSPINLCVGIAASPLTATGTNLKWYTVATGGTPAATLTPSTANVGTVTYYVSQTNSFGCEGPRASLVVNVRPSPTVTITPRSMPAFVFCVRDSIVLKANSATAVSYQWQKGSTPLPGSTRDTFTVSTTATYGVIVKDIYGCADTENVYVMENPLPTPKLSPTDVVFCEGTIVMLYASPATKGYRYDWYKDGTVMGVDTAFSKTPVSAAGIYRVVVKDTFTCVVATNTSVVSTYPAITKPQIVQTGSDLKTKIAYASYQWYRNGKLIAGATSRNYTVSFDGLYHVTVKDVNGCEGISDTVNYTQLGIGQDILPVVRLYPNPTSSKVNIDAGGPVNVIVRDIAGKQVLQLKEVSDVDLSPYADGLYMFYITNKQGTPLLIEKVNKFSGR